LDALTSQIVMSAYVLREAQNSLRGQNQTSFALSLPKKSQMSCFRLKNYLKKESVALKDLDGDRRKRDKLKEDIARLDSDIRNLSDKLERLSKLSDENKELEELKKKLIPSLENNKPWRMKYKICYLSWTHSFILDLN